MTLTPKQEAFLEYYSASGDAFEAAVFAEVALDRKCPTAGSYVYLLVCPQTSAIVYVGKGTGRRMHHHVRDVKAGRVSGVRKHQAIRGMLDGGKQPVAVVFQNGLDSDKALDLEKSLIDRLGLERLANSAPGTGCKWRRSLAMLNELESRIMPYEQWLRVRNPKPEHRHYHAVVVSQIAETRAWIQSRV